MDMGGHSANLQYLTERYPHAKVLRWTTHLNAMRKAADLSRTRKFWLISTCCDYTNFNFGWEPVPWESYQIHCWSSGLQKLGDTFLVPTGHFKQQNPERIDLYQDINWQRNGVKRLPPQYIKYEGSDLVAAVQTSIETPYALVTNIPAVTQYDPQLWKDPCIVSLNRSQSISLIPRQSTSQITKQIYDYPYLKQFPVYPSCPMDVVFIDNGEATADENYEHLSQILAKKNNKLHRITGVQGRVAAFSQAGNIASSDWVFIVTAKLKIDENFDFMWQPDYWQQPKHYVFTCLNTDTGLEYGHMAMVAFNRELMLTNDGTGLDYTLNQSHEVVSLRSGTANLGDDDQVIWRTTFREVIKLKHYLDQKVDIETEYRLRTWLTRGKKKSIEASQDAVEYYDVVNGNFDELKLSYEWKWCDDYYAKKYLNEL